MLKSKNNQHKFGDWIVEGTEIKGEQFIVTLIDFETDSEITAVVDIDWDGEYFPEDISGSNGEHTTRDIYISAVDSFNQLSLKEQLETVATEIEVRIAGV